MPSICNSTTMSEDKSSQAESDTIVRQCLSVIEKKVRNMEKRKCKLDGYKQKLDSGEKLIKDQTDALEKYEAVIMNLEFARDIHKQLQGILAEVEKQQKKMLKRQQVMKEIEDVAKQQNILRLQFVLKALTSEKVRTSLSEKTNNSDMLEVLEEFGKLVAIHSDEDCMEQVCRSAEHLVKYSEKKDAPVIGTTYSSLNEFVNSLLKDGPLLFMEIDEKCSEEEIGTVEENVVNGGPVDNSFERQEDTTYVAACSEEDTSEQLLVAHLNSDPVSVAVEQSLTDYTAVEEPQAYEERPIEDILMGMQCSFNFLQESEVHRMTGDDLSVSVSQGAVYDVNQCQPTFYSISQDQLSGNVIVPHYTAPQVVPIQFNNAMYITPNSLPVSHQYALPTFTSCEPFTSPSYTGVPYDASYDPNVMMSSSGASFYHQQEEIDGSEELDDGRICLNPNANVFKSKQYGFETTSFDASPDQLVSESFEPQTVCMQQQTNLISSFEPSQEPEEELKQGVQQLSVQDAESSKFEEQQTNHQQAANEFIHQGGRPNFRGRGRGNRGFYRGYQNYRGGNGNYPRYQRQYENNQRYNEGGFRGQFKPQRGQRYNGHDAQQEE